MVPVDHPRYEGFELEETDEVTAPHLRKVVRRLERSFLQAPYECYRIYLYPIHKNGSGPAASAELLNVPKAKRAEISQGNDNEGIDCNSPEEAVKAWLEMHGR